MSDNTTADCVNRDFREILYHFLFEPIADLFA